MIKKICLLVNYNLYESKRHFTKKLAEAMQRHGIITKIIDIKEKPLQIDQIEKFKPDLTCSFNSFSPLPNREFLWDYLQIPHLSILVDPAVYSIHLTQSPYSLISCVDRSDCAAMQAGQFNNVFFWPHAIERELCIPESSEKIYDVVFIGSCHDYEALRLKWQKELTPPLSKAMDDAIELVLTNRDITIAEALTIAWNDAGLAIEGVNFARLFYYVDYYTRGIDRVQLIQEIKDFPVHVFGDLMIDEPAYQKGWSYYLGSQSNVTIHPSVSFSESFNILRKSKLCLNSMPFFKDGTHERVFTGFACGALPVSSYSKYLAEQFAENVEHIFYDSFNVKSLNETVSDLLQHEKLRQEEVIKGQAKILQSHTWDKRVEELTSTLNHFYDSNPYP